ncbi:MAG: hypothetical protein JWO11_3067 [Nocardioides sp.]|nr:hypothetical protein [Nocardioides sp.]
MSPRRLRSSSAPSRGALLLCAVVMAALLSPMGASGGVEAAARQGRPGHVGSPLPCAQPALQSALPVRYLAHAKDLSPAQETRLTAFAVTGWKGHKPARAQALALLTALGDLGIGATRQQLGRGPRLTPRAFYRGLGRIPGWETLPPSIVAHQVLGTPDPFALESQWPRALGVLAELTGFTVAEASQRVAPGARSGARCAAAGATDARGFPLPAGTGYAVLKAPLGKHPDGRPVLLGAPCGTAVLAAVSGTAQVWPSTNGSGPWRIAITGGGSGVTTVYEHVARPAVKDGDLVVVGKEVAEVGDLGHVPTCALGLRVERDRKALTSARTVAWLASIHPAPVAPPPPPTPTAPTTVRVATLNVLGSHLTAPGGGKRGFAPGPTRMAQALSLLDQSGASIVTLNEFETPPANVVLADPDWDLHRATPNNTFRDGNSGGNAVAWRTDTWKLVSATEFTVSWKVTLHMPVVRLRNLDTGAKIVVVAMHNPASTRRQGNQSGARNAARAAERTAIAGIMESTGLPVIVAGDMNERTEALCGFTSGGLLTTYTGGASTCAGYGYGGVDFIFGGGDLTFQDRTVNRATLGRVSDHPLVTSLIRLGAQAR